ncbi:MAG: PEP-CTERM sorting domain-containing protein [Cyanobacteria bacterium CRU_2_1]|nr:PEP-CTERM sorting domain-containing protein [Cyanobacteria bacterium RU_5_0]NJR57673.1 PEP-CTERM sorting domain-containing protein [Cyanobacteria bacterium CRU_2_1]
MKTSFLTSLVAAAAAFAGAMSIASPANAFSWNDSWTQPVIQSKSQTGFDDALFQKFVQQERIALPNTGLFQLDPSNLFLKYDHTVSVHFINEGAGYRNQLAYEATGATNISGLVFNDISSAEAIGNWGGDALNLGDSTSLGRIAGGTQLDFWLRADGLNRGNSANIFGTKTESNLDRLEHVVAYAYNNYILLGFEDLYGGLWASGQDTATGKWNEFSDRDFNDVVMVLDVGEANVREMMGVPEPSVTLAMVGMGVAGALGLRRRKNAIEQ